MKLKTLLVILAVMLAVFHVFWYVASRTYVSQGPPSQNILDAYYNQPLKNFRSSPGQEKTQHIFIETNGVRLHLSLLEQGKDYPSVVFIPGMGLYAGLYIEFMDALNKKGFNVIGFDPRGHGLSSGPRGDYTLDEIVDDALAAVIYARDHYGWNVSVVGTGQGGIAALYCAARNNSLASVVCHNISLMDGKHNLESSSSTKLKALAPYFGGIMSIYRSYTIPLSLFMDFTQMETKCRTENERYLENDPECVSWITVRALKSLYKTEITIPVDQITVPIMVLQAEKDPLFPLSNVVELYEQFTCKKRLYIVEGSDHLIMINDVPGIIEPVTEWLRSSV